MVSTTASSGSSSTGSVQDASRVTAASVVGGQTP